MIRHQSCFKCVFIGALGQTLVAAPACESHVGEFAHLSGQCLQETVRTPSGARLDSEAMKVLFWLD